MIFFKTWKCVFQNVGNFVDVLNILSIAITSQISSKDR